MRAKLLFIALLFSLLGAAQSFTGTGGAIPDNVTQIEFPLTVSGLSQTTLNADFGLKQICLNINHTYDSDLNVYLVSPSGVAINLFSGIGGGDDNFTNTCLSQTATANIGTASAPFSGTFKPQETIGNVNNGQNPNGIWKLRILDTYPADQGTLINWSVTFGSNASNLPIVLVNTNGQTIVDEPSIVATMKIIDNGSGNLNYVTDNTFNYNGKINIEYRGNYSQSLPQKPYKVETLDDAEASVNASLLGMPAESDWALVANYNDKVFMRNQLAYNLFSQMGHYGSRTKHCEVVVNGIYQGVFILTETIKRNANRVNIAKLDPDENTGLDLTGGYIFKNDYWSTADGWQLNHNPVDHPELTVGLAYHYPKATKISDPQKAYIAAFVDDFENALYSANYTSPTDGYLKYMDEESFIDYFIINELSRNNDGFKKSCYFYKDKDSSTEIAKLHAGPVWDFDWAWKNIDECSFLAVTDGSGWAHLVNDCGPDVNGTGWWVRLLQDPSFQNHLRCRWETLRATTLSTSAMFNYIDATATYLDQAQARQFERWGNLGVNTGAPEVDNDPATFEGQITKFKTWISTRVAWLDANIPGDGSSCALAVNQNIKNNLQMVPNPANQFVTLTVPAGEKIKKVDVLDLSGKLIFTEQYFQNSTALDIKNFASGMYIVKIQTSENATVSKKLIVVH